MPLILSVAPTLVVSGEPELPSFDLGALCCASVLQLARLDFTLQPSSSLSEPSLIDDNDETAGLASILRRCALPPRQADERAFTALALSRLTALVEHSLFSLPQNYVEITRPRYAAGLPIPQRFILPGQLRLRAKERLEREGLWNLGGEVEADEKAEREKKIKGEGLDTDLIAKAKADEAERKERVRREFEKLKARARPAFARPLLDLTLTRTDRRAGQGDPQPFRYQARLAEVLLRRRVRALYYSARLL